MDKKPAVPIGFAGLSSLVSDVDGLIAKVTARADTQPPKARVEVSSPANESYAGQKPASSRKATWWIAGLGGVFVLWLIGTLSSPSTSTVPSATPTAPIRVPEATVALPQPSPADSSSPPAGDAGIPVPSVSEPQERSHTTVESSIEELPPVGTGVAFGPAQLRYCLAEQIRLGAVRTIAEADTAVIEQFNRMAADFNSRCVDYRYLPEVFDSVQRSVEANRASLQAEGIARVRH